jgi:hypothetical protein
MKEEEPCNTRRNKMVKMKHEGVFSYTTNEAGRVTFYRYKNSDFDNLRQELRALREAIE